MSADLPATEQNETHHPRPLRATAGANNTDAPNEDAEDEEEEEDDEPKLKYTKLTGNLASVYRNGDSTSSCLVAGDKFILGTHNGNIHVLSLPGLEAVRTYHAHQATVTSLSVSPIPPPPSLTQLDLAGKEASLSRPTQMRKPSSATIASSPRGARTQQSQQAAVANVPKNQIYIATSSLDGHVYVSSLVDSNDVLLRNFARPVQAVALSPDYRSDRSYLSGGLAGSLILTVGGKAGVSSDANTNSAAAAASGWLGSIGLGANTGRDTVLHAGEGSISTIKWSLTGKWVVWVNEEGIKIMRSHIRLGEQSEDAWRRIAHAAKPNRKAWQDMAGVWKARAEWIDDRKLESEAQVGDESLANGTVNGHGAVTSSSPAKKGKRFEKLVVGWGDTAWILHVHEGGTVSTGRQVGERQVGSADIVHKLQFRDCIVSGISLFTPSLLAILAYRTRDDDDRPINTPSTAQPDTPTKSGRRHRRTGLAPQLRLVNVANGEEVDLDELSISRFETLSAQDYHLATLFMPTPTPADQSTIQQKGTLEAVWEASGGLGTGYAQRMFSSSASVLSRDSGDKDGESGRGSFASPKGVTPTPARRSVSVHPFAAEPGLKLFVQSPYDCVLAIKRDLSDHLEWLLEHKQYAHAWQLIDEHPETVDPSSADRQSHTSTQPTSPSKGPGPSGSLAEFFADDSTQASNQGGMHAYHSPAQKEKRRVGDLWLQQLVAADSWSEAGKIAGKVLGTSSRWEHWVWTFAQADKFDEITPYIPSTALQPPLPSLVYEVVLGHYISADKPEKVKQLLERWDPELFDASSVITAMESRLQSASTHELGDSDRQMLVEALAKLYLATGRARDALRCYIRAQNAEAAFGLIRDEKLLDAVADDVPGLLMLRVSPEQRKSAPLSELEDASTEAVQLLVEEAHRGTIAPETVIRQLNKAGRSFQPFLFFYLRALWRGPQEKAANTPRGKFDPRVDEGHALVEDHADLAVELFAEYDRALLMTFLRASAVYRYEKAAAICEQRHYIPELVYILSKTGQTKRALVLIIGELGDVSQAISFAKENPDLWDDLLDYSMDKPRFIRGLLEEVGTAINPIDLVRRIPEGLEIEGLRDGLARMVREYQVQYEISEGVAKVLRGEVGMGMDTLRAGQKKAVKFEVVQDGPDDVEVVVKDVPTRVPDGETLPMQKRKVDVPEKQDVKPGHCVGCGDSFSEDEHEPLIGFACGHVYHLSCLLRANPATANESTIERLLEQLGIGRRGAAEETNETYEGTRSVGAKVAHAHVIQNVVQGGCRRCVIPDGA